MRVTRGRVLLAASLLINVGVIGMVGVRTVQQERLPDIFHDHQGHRRLVEYLSLSDQQRIAWRDQEDRFLRELYESWMRIRKHREKMIREIFSSNPDLDVIEEQRALIALFQEKQQRRIIRQLLDERDILNAEQRNSLMELLVAQNPGGSMGAALAKQLHGN